MDWTAGWVSAQGVGLPRRISPLSDVVDGDLAGLADRRAAENLAATVGAIPADATRRVADVLDAASLAEVAAGLEETFRETLSDGAVLRRVRLPLAAVRARAGAAAPARGIPVSLDARGAGIAPALACVVRDPAGAEVWRGAARYAAVRGKSPIAAKVVRADGPLRADVVVSEADARRLRALEGGVGAVEVITESWVAP